MWWYVCIVFLQLGKKLITQSFVSICYVFLWIYLLHFGQNCYNIYCKRIPTQNQVSRISVSNIKFKKKDNSLKI